MSHIKWAEVKQLLDNLLLRWESEHGRKPKMKAVHEGHIGWASKKDLMESRVFDKQLIERDKVGNGRSEETNLVKILRRNVGGFRRMPSRGPYLPDGDIDALAEWIDAGMPD